MRTLINTTIQQQIGHAVLHTQLAMTKSAIAGYMEMYNTTFLAQCACAAHYTCTLALHWMFMHRFVQISWHTKMS